MTASTLPPDAPEPPDAAAPPIRCGDLAGLLDRDGPAHASPPGGAAAAAWSRWSAAARHVAGCPACAVRHGARLRALEPLHALRARVEPPGALDGLSTRVLAGVRAVSALPPGLRAGLSEAFLDAPRSLARWRALATAASLLLCVGGGLLASGRLRLDAGAAAPTADGDDLRDLLLEPFQARHAADDVLPGLPRFAPVALPATPRAFFLRRTAPGVGTERPAGAAGRAPARPAPGEAPAGGGQEAAGD